MIKWAYIRLVWRNNKAFALFSMALIALLQFLILFLITTFDTTSMVEVLMKQLPEPMRVLLQENLYSMLSFQGAAAFGFNHPLVIALLIISAVNIPVHHISRELDSGTLELLLAHPVRRNHLLSSLWISGAVILLAIILAALAGSLASILIFHHLDAPLFTSLIKISLNLWLLMALIFTYTLMIAVFGKTNGKAGNISAVITLVFYLFNLLAQLWDKLSFLKPVNIFNYFNPQKIIFGQGNFILDVIVLGILLIACYIISRWQFSRRDIP